VIRDTACPLEKTLEFDEGNGMKIISGSSRPAIFAAISNAIFFF
jgi:hypothetical protein